MQRASCKIRLNNDLGNVAVKDNVSPAELLVLQAIHGAGAVVDVEVGKMDKSSHAAELDRLRQTYAVKKDGSSELLVDALFPGARPTLPLTFKDIGVDAKPAPKKPAVAEIAELDDAPLSDDDLVTADDME